MALPCPHCHGGVPQRDLWPFSEMNWKACVDDNSYIGWINSWRDNGGGFPEHVEEFLIYLLTWPDGPVIWLADDPNRTWAPFFVTGHWRNVKCYNCGYMIGCRYCWHQTVWLYPGRSVEDRRVALQKLMLFTEPLFRIWLYRRGVPLPPRIPQRDLYVPQPATISQPPAGHRPTPPPPPLPSTSQPLTPLTLQRHEELQSRLA